MALKVIAGLWLYVKLSISSAINTKLLIIVEDLIDNRIYNHNPYGLNEKS